MVLDTLAPIHFFHPNRGTVMGLLSFLVLCLVAFFLWRISDQMPDVLFRLSEIQKDIAELRRQRETSDDA
jgi:hypothetical protein